MKKLLVKAVWQLTSAELNQINQAKEREFKAHPLEKSKLQGVLFFLLFEDGVMLSIGELISVEPVIFRRERFSLLGIGGVVANVKGKGYGKQIMTAIKEYLVSKKKTGLGFCALKNKGFYEKCGFKVDTTLIKRFIFRKKNKIITNLGDDCVLSYDSSDKFMEKLLSYPGEVRLPRPPDW